MRACGALRLAILLLGACGDPSFRTDIEDRVSTTQGIYGQALVVTKDGSTATLSRWVYAWPDGDFDREPLAVRSGSSGDGFFQLPLPAGAYLLCSADFYADFGDCIDFTMEEDTLLRRDYLLQPGGGSGWATD